MNLQKPEVLMSFTFQMPQKTDPDSMPLVYVIIIKNGGNFDGT